MYEAFFSLEDAPFVLTPDPRFLLRSKGHHEILSTLLYGITSQKGLMALIGDVGTGKTTLCRALLRELPETVQSALVLNPHLSDTELLGAILDDLGIERRGTTKGELMTVLSQHLLAAGEQGKTVVVILDEAQQMGVEALEQIRILSTLETATRKLLQIVLAGQPELEEKLKRRELRQLDQRISIRCYLKPLSKRDTFRYVEHRMRIAGLPGALPFTRSALNRIYGFSGGIPRVINMVCDRALMAAYSARAREVAPGLIRNAIRNIEGQSGRKRWRAARGLGTAPWMRHAARAAAAVAVVAALAAAAYWTDAPARASALLARASTSLTTASDAPASVPGPAPSAAVPAAPAPTAPVAERPAPRAIVEPSAPSAPAGTATPASAPAPPRVSGDGLRGAVAQALALWGVRDDFSAPAMRRWPAGPSGDVDVPSVASRYQLSATWLRETTLAELAAIGLPAIVEHGPGRRPQLLRRLQGEQATLIGPGGEEARLPARDLEAAWTRSAWILWRNVDLLPEDPMLEMTPTVVATVALRLQKLGHLAPPLPTSNGDRLQGGVRRFQRTIGLHEDGLFGPRTTLALSRVVGGRFNPVLVESR